MFPARLFRCVARAGRPANHRSGARPAEESLGTAGGTAHHLRSIPRAPQLSGLRARTMSACLLRSATTTDAAAITTSWWGCAAANRRPASVSWRLAASPASAICAKSAENSTAGSTSSSSSRCWLIRYGRRSVGPRRRLGRIRRVAPHARAVVGSRENGSATKPLSLSEPGDA